MAFDPYHIWLGTLTSKAGSQNRVQITVEVPEHYRLTAVTSRVSPKVGHGSWITVGLPIGKCQTMFALDNDLVGDPYAGLHRLDNKPPWENEAHRRAPAVADGVPAAIVLTVYRERLTVDIDGKRVIDWEGDPQRFSVGPEWAPRDARRFYVGSDCAVRFSKLELVPLDGERPLDAQGEKLPIPAPQQIARARAALNAQPQPAAQPGETPRQKILVAVEKRIRDSFFADDPPVRYEMLDLARKESARVGNFELAFRATDELAGAFAIDSIELKVATLTELAKESPPIIPSETVEAIVEAAVEADRYPEAFRALALGTKAAAARKDKVLNKQFVTRKILLSKQQVGFNAMQPYAQKLRDQPDDAEASLAVGKFYSFIKRDWWRGLPYLARSGGEPALKAIAQRDLARPGLAAAQRQLANDWWEQSQKEIGDAKLALAERAGYWFRRVYPTLPEAEKAAVRERVRVVDILLHTEAWKQQFLTETLETKVAAWANQFRKGSKGDGAPIMSNGQVSPRGIYLHPPDKGFSAVTYDLGKSAKRLILDAGIDDAARPHLATPLVFEVRGDGRTIWSTPPLRNADVAHCDVEVSGVQSLELRVACDGSNRSAWAVWLEPQIIWKPPSSAVAIGTNANSTASNVANRQPTELLRNPGCEEPLQEGAVLGWVTVQGRWGHREREAPPLEGTGYFRPLASAEAELRQDVDVSSYAKTIDAGKQLFEFKGYLRSYVQKPPDTARVVVEYRDGRTRRCMPPPTPVQWPTWESGTFFRTSAALQRARVGSAFGSSACASPRTLATTTVIMMASH